jgi:threonine dehydratase
MSDALVTVDDIRAARKRLLPFVRRTSLDDSAALSAAAGAPVSLKMESWQVTGSFKPRISFNKLLTLDDATMKRGVVASTAGGHGIGVAYAAKTLHVAADLFVPASIDPTKLATILSLVRSPENVHRCESVPAAREAARAFAAEHGRTFVSAYNDPAIIAGSGTIGLEIVEDAPDVDLVVVGAGGGGIAVGLAIAVKAHNPKAEVWAVQSEVNAPLVRWLEAGHPVDVATAPSIADGLGAALERDSITFPLAQRWVDRGVTVSEAAIADAVRRLYAEHRVIIEPSGAAPVAAILAHDVRRFRRVVAVLTGRNVARQRFAAIIKDGR